MRTLYVVLIIAIVLVAAGIIITVILTQKEKLGEEDRVSMEEAEELLQEIPSEALDILDTTAVGSITDPTMEPTAEPTTEPTPMEPTAEPTTEPTPMEPTAEPAVEPTTAPTPMEPTAEPTTAPTPMEPTAEPSAEPAAESTLEVDVTVQNDWVLEHNRIRSEVNQPPIKWNQKIADKAKAHVDRCVFQHSSDKFRKFNGVTLGENLSYGSPYAGYSDADMVKMWEEEKEFYTYPEKPGESKKGETGHYTQVVNKNVKEIGCACARCDGNDKICACQYNPGQYGDEPPY